MERLGSDEIPTKILHTFGVEQPESPGMFGGLPSCTNQFAILRDSDVEARFAAGEMPVELTTISGRLEVYPAYAQTSMRRGDVYRTVSQGGGGYGDPLDRDPARVARDVENGLVSVEWARRAYGVVLSGGGDVEQAATGQLRRQLREERREAAGRLGGEVPAPSPWQAVTEGIRLSEVLFYDLRGDEPQMRCRCGHILGQAKVPAKRLAAMARYPVHAIGPEVNPHAINGARFELREFYCPACYTRLEVEIARPEDPVLDDACLSPDWLAAQQVAPNPGPRA